MNCPSCRKEVPDNAAFCLHCGARLPRTVTDSTQMRDQNIPEERARSRAEILAQMRDLAGSVTNLVCPNCKAQSSFPLDTSRQWHEISCPKCNAAFKSRYVKIRAKRSRKSQSGRSFSIRVYDPGGGEHLIEFNHATGSDFELRSGDKAVFTYLKDELKVVQNLTTRRYMEVKKPSCFVATYLYGPDSTEVVTLRHFRDTVLLPSGPMSRLVGIYYKLSPIAIEQLGSRVWFRRVASWALRPFVGIARRWEAMQR